MRRLLVAVVLLAGCTDDGPAPRVTAPPAAELAPDARTPADFAAAACTRARLVEEQVLADAPADEVRAQLAQARELARAASRDARWIPLAGGLATLDEALRTDDAASAQVAIRVVRAECQPRT